MRSTRIYALLLIVPPALSGCATQTVLVPPGQPVLITRPVAAHVAHVSGRDANGWPTWAGDTVQQIPAGYVAQPLPAPPVK